MVSRVTNVAFQRLGVVALTIALMMLITAAHSRADEHSPLSSQSAQGDEMATDPKTECEAVMNKLLPFAQKMLTLHGEFFPFGGAMKPDGEIVLVSGGVGSEHPPSKEVISLIKAGFVAGARDGHYKATALVYDARVKVPETGEVSDAIAVSANHRDGYSVLVFFPYKIDAGKPVIFTPFAQKGEADIFPAP